MASSFEKSVKGATKIKLAPPKTKYIEHILVATHADEAGVGEVFRALQHRLRDSTWTVVFKSLITVHLMVREGSPNVTLAYLAGHRNLLATSSFTDAQTQGRNIKNYAHYLSERAKAYRDTKVDWVRAKETRLEKLSVDKGLLRETEVVQRQLTALLNCDVLDEPENEITVTAFRLLVLDLLALFQVLNQAMINILGHFFEMSKPDAERAMDVYRTFTKQTDYVVQYLQTARQFEHHTRVEVPKLKHAPVNLGRQLEDYLKDSDFETHRRQYLAELEVKKKGGSSAASSSKVTTSEVAQRLFGTTNGSSSTAAASSKPQPPSKAPEQDLIDFFGSIEQNQTPMNVQQQPQAQQLGVGNPYGAFQTGPTAQQQLDANGFQQPQQQVPFQTGAPFQQQNMSPFAQPQQQQQQAPQPLQPNFTGAGFGGYTPQPQGQSSFSPGGLGSIPQNSVANFQSTGITSPGGLQPNALQPQHTSTNPFRQSMLMSNPTGMGAAQPFSTPASPPTVQPLTMQRTSTNPFARPSTQAGPTFAQAPSTANPAMPSNNNFAASNSPFQSPPPLQPMATGTNPFARNMGGASAMTQQRPQTSGGIMPQATGTTNPFRQGAFMNHQTGQGWQHNQQAMGGGLDQLETIPVFPRPAGQTPWQQ